MGSEARCWWLWEEYGMNGPSGEVDNTVVVNGAMGWQHAHQAFLGAFKTGDGYITINDGPPLTPGKDVHLEQDWLVVPHPVGNFTAVPGCLSRNYEGYRAARADDPAFYLPSEAQEWAEQQPAARNVSFHPSVLWVPHSVWGARWHKLKKRFAA